MFCLTEDRFRESLRTSGLSLSLDNQLCPYYEETTADCFYLEVPARGSSLPPLVRALSLLEAGEETYFGGAFLWFDLWNIGSPQTDKIGWGITDKMRLAYGEFRPLEVAPVHRFREDELTELQAFLLQPFIFQWDANVVYPTLDRFAHVSHDGFVLVATRTNEIRELSRSLLDPWGPKAPPEKVRARFCRPGVSVS